MELVDVIHQTMAIVFGRSIAANLPDQINPLRKLYESVRDCLVSYIQPVDDPNVRFLVGPVNLTVHENETKQKIYVFGDIHTIQRHPTQTNSLSIVQFIRQKLSTSDSVELLMEYDSEEDVKLHRSHCNYLDVLYDYFGSNSKTICLDIRMNAGLFGWRVWLFYSIAVLFWYVLKNRSDDVDSSIQYLRSIPADRAETELVYMYDRLSLGNLTDFVRRHAPRPDADEFRTAYGMVCNGAVKSKDWIKAVHRLGEMFSGLMDQHFLFRLFSSRATTIIIYVGADHANVYRKAINDRGFVQTFAEFNEWRSDNDVMPGWSAVNLKLADNRPFQRLDVSKLLF